MTRSTVILDSGSVTVSSDMRTATGPDALWTIARARVVDELTGRPPASVVAATVEEERLGVRFGEDGRIGVIIQPWSRYPTVYAPGFNVHVNLSAPRYLRRRLPIPIVRVLSLMVSPGDTVLTVDTTAGIEQAQTWAIGDPAAVNEPVTIASLGPGVDQVTLASPVANSYAAGTAVAPGELTAVELGDVTLHRAGIVIHGRVLMFVPATRTWQPPSSATLTISAIWRRQADVTNELAKEAPDLLAIAPGLYRDRTAFVDALQPVDLVNIGGDEKTTLESLVPQSTAARVSNAKGLAVGATLQVDLDHPDVTELLPVGSFVPTGVSDEPASVAFTLPLAWNHRTGVGVRHVSTPNILLPKALDADGLTGDPVVFLSDVAFGGTPDTARIGSGTTAEYQAVSLFDAIAADADGYFDFPPISRVAKVRIVVTIPANPPQQIDLEPDYDVPDQWLDVKFV